MKTLIASALIIASSGAFAHDSSFSNNSCNVELNGGVRITQSEIEFTKNDKVLYRIINNDELQINNESISLTASQQSLVSEYSTSIRAVLPKVKTIAIDAIALASDGVNLAFDELLGKGNNVGAEITGHLSIIRDEIDNRFTQNNEFYINEEGFSGKEFFDEEFEQRIESAVEETIKNSMGSLMIAVGQEILFAGGNMDAFETRMEKFGEQIEYEMESRGEELEKRGNALCQSAIEIDNIEDQLKTQISELSEFDILSASHDSHNRI